MADDQINAVDSAVAPAPQTVDEDDQINAVDSAVAPAPQTVDQDDQVNAVNPVEPPVQQSAPSGGEPGFNTEPLRNAPLLPDNESESESQEVSEIQVPQHIVAWQTTQRYALEAYIWLKFFWTLLQFVTSKTIVVGKGVVRALQPQHYVYFKGSDTPYRAQDYTLSGPGVAPIEWYYDAEKYTFLSSNLYNTSTEYDFHHLPWLSAEIKYNDMTLYDITDHVEQIRFASSSGSPPPASQVLSSWSLTSGVVLNTKDSLVLHTLNEDGSESQIPC